MLIHVVSSVCVRARARPYSEPHANTAKTCELVKATFGAKNITILSEGEIKAEKIDKDQLIDQHYYAIASKVSVHPSKTAWGE